MYLKIYRKINRRRRTNIILTVISSVFFVSWAPLNILNVVINTSNPFEVKLTQKRDSLQHLSSQRRLWLLLMEFVTSLVTFWHLSFKQNKDISSLSFRNELCLDKSTALWVVEYKLQKSRSSKQEKIQKCSYVNFCMSYFHNKFTATAGKTFKITVKCTVNCVKNCALNLLWILAFRRNKLYCSLFTHSTLG